jgi:hypothetical protein
VRTHLRVSLIVVFSRTEIFRSKPENYGKSAGKKSKGGSSKKKSSGANVKYLLQASVSSSQGSGHRTDLRTVDPTSPFFLSCADSSMAPSTDDVSFKTAVATTHQTNSLSTKN